MKRTDWELNEPKDGFTIEEEDIVFKMIVSMCIESTVNRRIENNK
jgi:hypothetical protein|tara:strand:- start:716 stop:850 length:135 start_codon:yes stop_codon:yes gene_type:complete